jgi:hypothetical protein
LRETVKQEREPCPGPPSSCPGSFASPLGTKLIRHTPHPTHTHTYDALRRRTCVQIWHGAYASVGHNPCPGPGILTWFPFAGRCDAPFVAGATLHRLNDV